jgi:beta-glucanase (GH16 family)
MEILPASKKNLLKFFFVVTSVGALPACQTTETPDDTSTPTTMYNSLVWSDEFNDRQLNDTYWNRSWNDLGGGNQELQYYTKEAANSYMDNGNLVIQANKEPYLNRNFTSAQLLTQGKKDFQFGKIEIRAKLPKGKGLWSSIYMMPVEKKFGDYPKSGGINVMDFFGNNPNEIFFGSHFGDNKDKIALAKLEKGNYWDDYHNFSVVWDKDLVRWYIDDKEYMRLSPSDVSPASYPFNEKFYLVMQVAIGGIYAGDPDASTVFPQRMLIDYVRVYSTGTEK